LLNGNRSYVLHGLHMTHSNTDFTLIFFSSFGTHLLCNLIDQTDNANDQQTKLNQFFLCNH